MKKTLTIFLLFIISIQCLPVKQLGKLLFDNTFVEEECGKAELQKKQVVEVDFLFYQSAHEPVPPSPLVFAVHSTALHTSPAADVTTPPPNA